MKFGSRNLHLLFCITFLWRFCKTEAYVEVCETSPGTVYCNCDEVFYKDSESLYRVTCTVLQTVTERDPVWRSIGDAENISYLKLQPVLPVKIEYIPSDEFRRMANLRIFKIQQGNLSTLKSYALSGYKSLVELEIDGNEITALEPNAISDMPKLKKLTLSENLLQELLADSLKDLIELESLFLDRNNISRIEACAFCDLQNLKDLELWHNQISDLTEYTFRGLRYLKRLDLYKNKIRILNDKVFHTMPRLVELDLRDNMISHIASRAFMGLEKLQSLALGANNIKVLPNEVFAPLVSVRSVDINHNELEFLQKEVVDNMKNSKDAIFSLAFQVNPFKCDCVMQWVSTYAKLNASHRFTRELKELQCKLENETHTVVEYLTTIDCEKVTIESKAPVFVTKLITKSTASVPIELNSQNSKISPVVTVADDETETYLSDVQQKATSMEISSGVDLSNIHSCFVCCLVLLTVYFTRNREEM